MTDAQRLHFWKALTESTYDERFREEWVEWMQGRSDAFGDVVAEVERLTGVVDAFLVGIITVVESEAGQRQKAAHEVVARHGITVATAEERPGWMNVTLALAEGAEAVAEVERLTRANALLRGVLAGRDALLDEAAQTPTPSTLSPMPTPVGTGSSPSPRRDGGHAALVRNEAPERRGGSGEEPGLRPLAERLAHALERRQWGGGPEGHCTACDADGYFDKVHLADCTVGAILLEAERAGLMPATPPPMPQPDKGEETER